MDKKIVELLKSINNGKFSGSQRKLAHMLNVSDTSVSTWCKKEKKPSLDMISKMAKVFKKSEEEIETIFISNFENKNVNKEKENDLKDKEIELLKERIKLLEEELKFSKEQTAFYKEKSQTK